MLCGSLSPATPANAIGQADAFGHSATSKNRFFGLRTDDAGTSHFVGVTVQTLAARNARDLTYRRLFAIQGPMSMPRPAG